LKKTKGKVLFIGHTIPPLMSAQGLCNLYHIKYLSEFGWELDVLTTSPSPNSPQFDKSSIAMLPPSARIFRTYPGLHKIYYNIIKPKTNISKDKTITKKCSLSISKKILKVISNIMIPDATIFWYPFAVVQGLKMINKHKYDVLISYSSPVTCHFIGYTLKKLGNLHWIMACSDPWVFKFTYKRKGVRFWIDHKLEEIFLKSADAITVTTNETKENYLKNYPFLIDSKVNVIQNGVDYDEFENVSVEKSEKFRILLAGTINPNQCIEPFLDALKRVYEKEELKEQIEVVFVGNIDDEYIELIANKGLKERINVKGFISPKKIPSLIMGADVLFLFGARGGLQLASKIFYYIAARRPILYIKGDERDPVLKILQGLNRGVIVDNEKDNIYSGIIRLYNLYQEQELDKIFDLREIPDFSWRNSVEKLDKICERLV
jgi:glycosyltransferase involved in cell wall biosynthesis